jgi:hypothetical protein
MALLTLLYGVEIPLKSDGGTALFYPGSGPGVTFTVTLLLVMLITHVAVRGVWSIVVVLSCSSSRCCSPTSGGGMTSSRCCRNCRCT